MREILFIAVGAVVAALLQVLVAPHIGLFSAMPNFPVVFALLVAVVRPSSFGPVLPFLLGLFCDLFCGGPVGAMAFSLTAFSMATATILSRMSNDSRLMAVLVMGFGLLLVELSYGVFLLLFGYNANILEAVAYRVGPCFLYDLVVALVLYPLALRFLFAHNTPQSPVGITQLR